MSGGRGWRISSICRGMLGRGQFSGFGVLLVWGTEVSLGGLVGGGMLLLERCFFLAGAVWGMSVGGGSSGVWGFGGLVKKFCRMRCCLSALFLSV